MNNVNYTEKLDDKQRKIVNSLIGNFCVHGCPGSGKTHILAHRYAAIRREFGPYKCITCIVQTNADVMRLQKHIQEICGVFPEGILTIYDFAYEIVEYFFHEKYCNTRYGVLKILNKIDSLELIAKIAHVETDSYIVEEIKNRIEAYSSILQYSLNMIDKTQNFSFITGEYSEIIKEYLTCKQRMHVLDVNDVYPLAFSILNIFGKKLQRLYDFWDYIMVDDFHELTDLQREIVLSAAEIHSNLLITRNQYFDHEEQHDNTIYLKYKIRFVSFFLNTDYRNSRSMVAALRLIQRVGQLELLSMEPAPNCERGKVRLLQRSTFEETVNFVQSELFKIYCDYKKQGINHDFSDTAIVVRDEDVMKHLKMYANGVKYEKANDVEYFKSHDVRLMTAIWDMISCGDNVHNCILATQLLGFEDVLTLTLNDIMHLRSQRLGLWYDIFRLVIENIPEQDNKTTLCAFFSSIERWWFDLDFEDYDVYKKKFNESAQRLGLFERSYYDDDLKKHRCDESYHNPWKLLEKMLFVPRLTTNLSDVLCQLRRKIPSMSYSNINNIRTPKNVVRILTAKDIKGLEFERVYCLGMNEGMFPKENKPLNEERELMQLCLAATKKELTLCCSQTLPDWAVSPEYKKRNGAQATQSRFITKLFQ